MTDVASAVSGDGFGGLISQMQKNDKEADTANKGYIKKIEDTKTPSAPTLTPAPEMQQSDPMNGFGSAATWLATFGSLLTRRPLQNALNASADVMDAHKAQDAANFKQKWDKWKTESDNAWKMAEWNQELYKDLIGKTEAEQKITASSTKNKTLEMAIQAKMTESYHKDMMRQIKQGNEAKEKLQSYTEKHVAEDKKKWVSAGNTPESFDEDGAYLKWSGQGKKIEAGKDTDNATDVDWKSLKSTDIVPGTGLSFATIQNNAKALHDGVSPTQLGLGYSMNPVKKAVENYMNFRYPNTDIAAQKLEYTGKQTEEKIAAKDAESMVIATNKLDRSIPLLLQTGAKVDLSNFRNLNELDNYYKEHVNDPDLKAFRVAIEGTLADYSQLLARGGQVTDVSRNAARAVLDQAMSEGSLQSATDTMQAEGQNQKAAAVESLKGVTRPGGIAGKSPDAKHIKMLKDDPSEENKRYFDEAFGEGAAAKVLGQ